MHKLYNKFLIVCSIALLIVGVYSYFSHGLHSEAANTGGSLVSSNGASASSVNFSTDQKIALDTAFLSSLVSLNRIKIDNSLFSNVSFKLLHDNTVNLEQGNLGRTNPFAPIDATVDNTATPVSDVVTNEPSQVTSKTAVLNGSINSSAPITSSYFEYGSTPALGQTTSAVSQSLVGTFISKISGLSGGTTYFYRAVAKINGVAMYGEIVSFNTK